MHDSDRYEILQLWTRTAKGTPPTSQDALELRADEGVVGDHCLGEKRHVTFIFQDDWNAAEDELGMPVDPSARRANVLLSGGNGLSWIGKRMRLGSCLLEIHKETAPCSQMDEAAPGLMKALVPDGRGGVWGRILEGGTIQPGDQATEA